MQPIHTLLCFSTHLYYLFLCLHKIKPFWQPKFVLCTRVYVYRKIITSRVYANCETHSYKFDKASPVNSTLLACLSLMTSAISGLPISRKARSRSFTFSFSLEPARDAFQLRSSFCVVSILAESVASMRPFSVASLAAFTMAVFGMFRYMHSNRPFSFSTPISRARIARLPSVNTEDSFTFGVVDAEIESRVRHAK